MIQKIIITEGVDRSGKGTSLGKLEKIYLDKGYKVTNLFKYSQQNDKFNELLIKAHKPINAAKKKLTNHIKYDLFVLGGLEAINLLLIHLSMDSEKHIVLIDRFGLSNLVYGKILRSEEYKHTFKDKEIEVDNYIYSCIEALTTYSKVHLFLSTKCQKIELFDDNDNVNIKINKKQLHSINIEYSKMVPIIQKLSHYVPNLDFHHKELTKNNELELFNFMKHILIDCEEIF